MLNKLTFTGTTIENSHLYGGVSYTQELNGSDDFSIGTAASASIEFTTDITTLAVGNECDYYVQQASDSTWRLIGHFKVSEVERVKDITKGVRYKITAYDNIANFDVVIDDWLDGLTFPMTLDAFFTSLCTYCGCTKSSGTFVNSTQSLKDNFTSTNVTGRTILTYIGEMAAGSVVALPNGNISIKYYTANSTTLNNSKYSKYTKAEYSCDIIDKLWVGMEDGDIGVTSGTGTNEYRITYNPLFFADSTSEIQTAVDNVYNVIHAINYTPMTVTLYEDFSINAGDIVAVNSVNTLIMSKKITESGVEFESTGNKSRTAGDSSDNSAINALRGKYNVLKRDLTQTQSEVGDLAEGYTRITQTSSAIESIVSGNAEYTESATEPTEKTTGDVWYNTTTGVYQQWDGAQWVEVDESVKGAAVTNKITQTLDGVVYEGPSGTTEINGAYLKTGTINASDAVISNSITFGKLDSETQSKINNSGEIYRSTTIPSTTTEGALWYCMASQGTYVQGKWYTYKDGDWVLNETELPSYLEETYITSTSIYSPEIIGGTITAGGTGDGIVNLSSSGINYGSSTNSNIVGIGYRAASSGGATYLLPVIMFGQGIDASGTDQGMIKKYTNGIFIGDNDDVSQYNVGGSGTTNGLFVNFSEGKIYKYVNGNASELGSATFG